MTDELRAAVDRLRRLSLPGAEHEDVYPGDGWQGRHMRDLDAIADAYLAEHPADDGYEMPFDAWSFCRDVLVRGTAIERHCEAKGLGYEQLSARLDAAAREYADRLKPHLKPTEPTP